MIMAFTIDWQAALVFVATIRCCALWCSALCLFRSRCYPGRCSPGWIACSALRAKIHGVRVLRAFCKENEEIAEFETRNEDLTGVQKFVGRISALMNPVTYLIINFAVIALIWTGALRVESGIPDTGYGGGSLQLHVADPG